MLKIKNIHERLILNAKEYQETKLLITKRTLAFTMMLYYTSLLFTIGGFPFLFITKEILATLTYHLFSILIVVVFWFIFSLIEYIQHIYLPEKKLLTLVGGVFCVFFGLLGLFAHIGTKFI